MVREDGHERPMPERLEVAGVTFDREQFECLPIPSRYLSKAEADSLRDEMRKDGLPLSPSRRPKPPFGVLDSPVWGLGPTPGSSGDGLAAFGLHCSTA